jgi:hypothetical protein
VDRFSGALFRELAPMVVEDRSGRVCEAVNKRKVLQACERAIERIEDGASDLARPDLSLFTELRRYFAPADWEQADAVIRRNLRRAGIHYAAASRRDHLTLARG